MPSATIIQAKINRKKFFDNVRRNIFNGKLSQVQVDNINVIIDEWESRKLTDKRWLAYIFATIYHETAHTMQPIEEYGKGKGYKYGIPDKQTGKIYYGRGFCQITWKSNYETMGDLLGVDLVNHPEMALDCKIATDIIFEGMIKGLFTGKSLSDYFKGDILVNHDSYMKTWVQARKIINGLDKADLIAGYALKFLAALT